MKQLVVNLSLDQYMALEQIALQEQITLGEVVRRAIDQYLHQNRALPASDQESDLLGIAGDLLDRGEHTAL